MEIEITSLFDGEFDPRYYSASVAELGNDAGKITWSNALDREDINLLDTDEKRQAFRDHVQSFGAWNQTEIDNWSYQELNALLIQCISGDIRSGEDSRLFTGDDNKRYYYLGD